MERLLVIAEALIYMLNGKLRYGSLVMRVVCFKMESRSIFSLNDDCLCNILSYLNDFSAFYSFSLTCKRFNHLAESQGNWNVNIIKRKAKFYIRQFVVYSDESGYESRKKLCSLLEKAEQCSVNHLSYNNILNVWKSCGPVAAKFSSWIKHSSSVTREDGPRETCSTEYAKHIFHLPSCGQDLSINTSHFVDYIGNYDRETNFKVSCGDLKIENEVSRIIPEDYDYWDEEEMSAVVGPMKPVIQLLQKELGETVPPITDQFFVWMCFRFPRLSQEHRINFKDDAKNAKPTLESLRKTLEDYNHNKLAQLQKPVEKWLKGQEESYSAKMIASVVETLVRKSKRRILRQLREDVDRFADAIYDYDLRKVPKKMMLDLINRTTLFLGNYSAGAVADKYVDNKAEFRMKGGSVIKIDGGMRGDGASYPTWYELSMNFHLPDGNNIEIQTPFLMYTKPSEHQMEALIKKFSPITEILQECIDKSMKGEKVIPKIENIFTVCYFTQVMQFSGAADWFLGDYDKSLFKSDHVDDASDSDCSDSSD